MDFQDLLVFRAVVHCGNITRAAEQSGFSQPAISRRVQRMERELGHILFDRTTVPVHLTPQGTRFLDFAETVLNQWETFQEAMNGPSALGGELRIASSSAPVDAGISNWVGAFVAQYPRVAIQWLSLSSQTVETAVRDHRVAVGFMGCSPQDCCLGAEQIGTDEIVLAVPMTPPFAMVPDPCPVAALATIPLVQREEGSGTRATVRDAFIAHGFPRALHIVAEVDSADSLLSAVAAGWGAGFVSAHTRTHHYNSRIRTVRIKDIPLHRTLYMVSDPVVLARSPLVGRFHRFVLDCAGENPAIAKTIRASDQPRMENAITTDTTRLLEARGRGPTIGNPHNKNGPQSTQ